MVRRTKIVATVGPACDSEETLADLIEAGVDVFRFNFSHGEQQEKGRQIERIRKLAREKNKTVSILADLQGPKIRVGRLAGGELGLKSGETVTITSRDVIGGQGIIPVTYEAMAQDVRHGSRVLIDDGLLELEAVEVSPPDVICRVKTGGVITEHKGINLPGVAVSAEAVTAKDESDLLFCVQQDVDFVAMSFVRQAGDLLKLKKVLFDHESSIQIIAKIERPEAVNGFDSILKIADGIMVARGDLGVEMNPEKVPRIQKNIIRKCNEAGKPVITATQMLESMIDSPRPTRAETSDVANAVLDGTDAVMLSGETAMGQYPVEAVKVLDRVACDIEESHIAVRHFAPLSQKDGFIPLPEALGQVACRVAEELQAAAILAFTQTGNTAALVAKYRPALPIIAVTPSEKVQRRMTLYRGVTSVQTEIAGNTEEQIDNVEKRVLDSGILKKGDIVVITMGSPVSAPGTTNLIKAHRLGTGPFYEVY